MSQQSLVEHFEISLQSPAGEVSPAVGVPTSLVPVTAILPLIRGLGEEVQALELGQARELGLVTVLGVNERDHGSLYNTQLVFDADGRLVGALNMHTLLDAGVI